MVFPTIQAPSRGEIIRALKASGVGEELTDRELWILEELGGDSE